jgi:hypothetical protein
MYITNNDTCLLQQVTPERILCFHLTTLKHAFQTRSKQTSTTCSYFSLIAPEFFVAGRQNDRTTYGVTVSVHLYTAACVPRSQQHLKYMTQRHEDRNADVPPHTTSPPPSPSSPTPLTRYNIPGALMILQKLISWTRGHNPTPCSIVLPQNIIL